MMKNAPVIVLEESVQVEKNQHFAAEIIDFEIDVLGEPIRFHISVEHKQAKLSEIIPPARELSESCRWL